MHIVHLACAMDGITSILLDLVEEDPTLLRGNSKESKLETLWLNYRDWCEASRFLTLIVTIFFFNPLQLYFGKRKFEHTEFFFLAWLSLRSTGPCIPSAIHFGNSQTGSRKTLRSKSKDCQCYRMSLFDFLDACFTATLQYKRSPWYVVWQWLVTSFVFDVPPLLKLKDQTTDIPPQEKTSTNILNGFGVN